MNEREDNDIEVAGESENTTKKEAEITQKAIPMSKPPLSFL